MQDIYNYLELCPITNEDIDLLQAKIQKTPTSLNGKLNIKILIIMISIVFVFIFIFRLVLLYIITIG